MDLCSPCEPSSYMAVDQALSWKLVDGGLCWALVYEIIEYSYGLDTLVQVGRFVAEA